MKEGWEYKKLGDITTTINGLWTGKKPPFKTVAVVRNTNFTKDCNLDMSNIAFIDVEERQYATRKLVYGDIIIEKSGGSDKQPVGRPVLFEISDGDYSFSNFTSTLRIKNTKEIIPRFLHKALYEAYLRGETFKMQSKTTGIHNLDFKAYNKLLIPTPPISEQQRIVEELDLLSSIIEKKKAQLNELDNLAQSLFYEMFGDPITNEKGWEVKPLGKECTELKYGTSKPACENGKYKYLRMGNLTINGELDLSSLKTIDIPDDEVEKCVVRYGDILFNRTNSLDLIGKTCMFNLDEPMVIAGYIIRVRLSLNLNPRYISAMFNMPRMKLLLKKMAKGAVNQANINSKELASILTPIPPLDLQQQFASKIEVIEHQKELIKQSIKEVETLFNSRMDYYFN